MNQELNIVPTDNKIKVETWMEIFVDKPVFFQVYYLDSSYYIWIGQQPPKLNSMCIALQTKYVCFKHNFRIFVYFIVKNYSNN